MYCYRFNIGFGVFRSNENHCKIFKIKCHVEVVFFRPWIWPMLMKNTQNPPFLHVKRENTRKTATKMVENTLVSQIDKILKIYPRLDEYISFPFFPGSRTGFKRLCGHILVSSKGDQTYRDLSVSIKFCCTDCDKSRTKFSALVPLFVRRSVHYTLIFFHDSICLWP